MGFHFRTTFTRGCVAYTRTLRTCRRRDHNHNHPQRQRQRQLKSPHPLTASSVCPCATCYGQDETAAAAPGRLTTSSTTDLPRTYRTTTTTTTPRIDIRAPSPTASIARTPSRNIASRLSRRFSSRMSSYHSMVDGGDGDVDGMEMQPLREAAQSTPDLSGDGDGDGDEYGYEYGDRERFSIGLAR